MRTINTAAGKRKFSPNVRPGALALLLRLSPAVVNRTPGVTSIDSETQSRTTGPGRNRSRPVRLGRLDVSDRHSGETLGKTRGNTTLANVDAFTGNYSLAPNRHRARDFRETQKVPAILGAAAPRSYLSTLAPVPKLRLPEKTLDFF